VLPGLACHPVERVDLREIERAEISEGAPVLRERQALFPGRDRMGIKPLYYDQKDACLLYASEVKAFLTIRPSNQSSIASTLRRRNPMQGGGRQTYTITRLGIALRTEESQGVSSTGEYGGPADDAAADEDGHKR
jgi:Glutamine amidotransferase domain